MSESRNKSNEVRQRTSYIDVDAICDTLSINGCNNRSQSSKHLKKKMSEKVPSQIKELEDASAS